MRRCDGRVAGFDTVLFFDDTPENVEGARNAGVHSVFVQAPSDVRQALLDIGAL